MDDEVCRYVILDRVALPKKMHVTNQPNLYLAGPGQLLTATLILGETWTFLRRRSGQVRAI